MTTDVSTRHRSTSKSAIGARFGRLLVIGEEERRPGRRYLLCRCDCGTEKAIRDDGLKNGVVVSCGCWHKERVRANKVHGYWNKPEYAVWQAIVQRCCNHGNKYFHNYGGRGIGICPEWSESFAKFIADVGPRPSPEMLIERVDNSRGYEPGNVVWASRKEQQRNLRSNHILTYRGRAQCVAAWCEEFGLNRGTFEKRRRLGWPLHEALTRPVNRADRRPQARAEPARRVPELV